MIITDAILFHFPTTVLTFGSNVTTGALQQKYATIYAIMEKIQMTAFSIQESIISGLYVYETRKILKPGEGFQKKRTRRVMIHLIYINIMIICMDVALLSTEYANLYEIQTVFKAAVYSVKLRLEFSILNQLMAIVQGRNGSNEGPSSMHSRGTIRNMALDTFNNRSTHDSRKNMEAGSTTYSVFATKAKPTSDSLTINEGCISMTTEVVVRGDETNNPPSKSNKGDGYDSGFGSKKPGTSTIGSKWVNGKQSPASSELEFAGAGV
jgi:hypothetical protein